MTPDPVDAGATPRWDNHDGQDDGPAATVTGAPSNLHASYPCSALVFDIADRDCARTLAGALENLVDPPPEALTLFEAPDGPLPWRITAYFETPPDPEELRAHLSAFTGRDLEAPRLQSVPDLNWVLLSQAALPPVHAGRFTVHGSHDAHRVPQGPNAILIDAGEAFGTAHHATTYGCLLEIDRLTRGGGGFGSVLDLGCGSGVLAIAVGRAAPRSRIIASDIDAVSVMVAAQNGRRNPCPARIRWVNARGLDHSGLRAAGPYDLLIANILAGPLIALSKRVAQSVRPGGWLILSGLLNDQSREIVATYNAVGFHLERHTRIAGWSTLVMVRRTRLPAR